MKLVRQACLLLRDNQRISLEIDTPCVLSVSCEPAVSVRLGCAISGMIVAILLVAVPTLRADSNAVPASQPICLFWQKDEVARRQEMAAFNSLVDGHPAAPGDWELELGSGWNTHSHRSDSNLLDPTLKYTPHRYTSSGYEFFENAQLSLHMPLELGNGEVTGNGDLTFGWQERWVKESNAMPTLASLAQIRMPTGETSTGTDGILTGIIDKDFGPGTIYLNGYLRTANDNTIEELRPFQWGVRGGYQWRLSDRTALIADYVHESSQKCGHHNRHLLELSAQFRTVHHLSFGPGIAIGLDGGEETPQLAVGFRLIYLFNARNPPPPDSPFCGSK